MVSRKVWMKFGLSLCAAALMAGCVSRGSSIRKLGDDAFEVRAWDGFGCSKTTDNKSCFSLLMPIIKDKAEQKCEGGVEMITPCMRYEASSADRIVCKVSCKESDEGEEEGVASGQEDESPQPSQKKQKK